MAKYNGVSISVIRRMPRYYRFLGELKDKNIFRISSKELAERMGLTASQIRQDLNCFGGFGQQGYGYNVPVLHQEIGNILGISNCFKTIIIGAGNLGKALTQNLAFQNLGFELVGVFDNNPELKGVQMNGFSVRMMEELEVFCAQSKPSVAIMCLPDEAVEKVCPRLLDCGINGFWNFTHVDIARIYPGTTVENVHLDDGMMTLCYKLNDNLIK
ncbi:MAG: redox-sensing transcriptional repressor Rex [Oscillospiraceae bacterium]|nr:redox-sensing transcriptional repressor Rex [Oscillospiraceae bacterium]